jgi:short-subunit dehydrogenase
MPGPYYVTYAASKAFLLSFAEAIRHELKDTGVTVTALMPGPTDTEFFDRAGMQDTPVDEGKKDDPAEVARDAFRALMSGRRQSRRRVSQECDSGGDGQSHAGNGQGRPAFPAGQARGRRRVIPPGFAMS